MHLPCFAVWVYEAAVGRQSSGTRERHLWVLRQPQEGSGRVVRRRRGGGTRSQISGARWGVHPSAGDQYGATGRRRRGHGDVSRPDIHR